MNWSLEALDPDSGRIILKFKIVRDNLVIVPNGGGSKSR